MAFSHKKMLFTVQQILLILFTIFIASPQSGVACRPLLVHNDQWSSEYGLVWQLLANSPAPPSGGGEPTHP
ncbi:hypothetical protein MtrunA17_Chr7g0260881 [Medicago truncatula]|uniref:Transmembrane protein, putative n=1 Tax=Medicago truncatula TaxID=3880 RepID=A0A072U2H4_MEDTR|nr:transmembrane protein, putative [Medicago truncatula]RHN48169.1 hypothetical protein MtrunA17_Chr7g0260881 [Medicago truncatula]